MMVRILHKANLLRFLLVAVLLLGILVLQAEKFLEVGPYAAYNTEVKSTGTGDSSKAFDKKISSSELSTLFAALEQNFSTEANILHVNFTLQQVIISVLSKSFAFPANEIIPFYSISAPGISFIAQIVPISILPNAP